MFTNGFKSGQPLILYKHVPYTTSTSQVQLALTDMNMTDGNYVSILIHMTNEWNEKWQLMCYYNT